MDTIIIKACVNGNLGREENTNVPFTPEEVAEEAIRCYYALITDNIREFYPDATWLVHSSGRQTFVLAAIAVATGAHIRVRFEDSPSLPNKDAPISNAEYVDWTVTLSQLHGREPASPFQARDILGLLPAP